MIGKVKKLSKKKKLQLIFILSSVAVFAIIFGIVYATLTNTLTITGTANLRDSKWKIKFDNLAEEAEKTETADVITNPQIIDDNHIGDYSISLTTPGDYVSYTFDIVNEGDYDAEIGDTFHIDAPECHGIGDNALTDCENVLSNLEYKLTYEDGTALSVGDIIESHSTITLKIKLLYKENVPTNELPQDDVEITNLDITIPFIQADSAKVNTDGTTPLMPTYSVGDEITIAGEQYYVIADSDFSKDYVTVLKANPLTVDEINTYGGVGTENNHVNRYTSANVGTAYDYNDVNHTGGMQYYSSSTCGYVNDSWVYNGCTTDYATSEVKYVIDEWAQAEFTNGEIKTVDGYGARLATKEELQPIGWPSCSSNATGCSKETDTPSWIYNSNYSWYWTMSQWNNSSSNVWGVRGDGGLGGRYVGNDRGAVRPVLNIYKSKI